MTIEEADIVNDLFISISDGSSHIDLPKVFSREYLRIDEKEIPTCERVRSRGSLKGAEVPCDKDK